MIASAPVIDREARDLLALLLRRLGNGRLTTYAFEREAWNLVDSEDLVIYALVDWAAIFLCDMRGLRLLGRRRLWPKERRGIAQAVLFLRSDVPYEWPPQPEWSLLKSLVWLLSLGRLESSDGGWSEWRECGEFDAWPFVTASDRKRVAAFQPFISDVATRPV